MLFRSITHLTTVRENVFALVIERIYDNRDKINSVNMYKISQSMRSVMRLKNATNASLFLEIKKSSVFFFYTLSFFRRLTLFLICA